MKYLFVPMILLILISCTKEKETSGWDGPDEKIVRLTNYSGIIRVKLNDELNDVYKQAAILAIRDYNNLNLRIKWEIVSTYPYELEIRYYELKGGGLGQAYPVDSATLMPGNSVLINKAALSPHIEVAYPLILHEIGHTLGIMHIQSGRKSIFNPGVTYGDKFTQWDINYLKQLFK